MTGPSLFSKIPKASVVLIKIWSELPRYTLDTSGVSDVFTFHEVSNSLRNHFVPVLAWVHIAPAPCVDLASDRAAQCWEYVDVSNVRFAEEVDDLIAGDTFVRYEFVNNISLFQL